VVESITGGDICFTGPAPTTVVDFPLSAAVKTPKKVPLMKCVPLPVSRKTDVPGCVSVAEDTQNGTIVGGRSAL